MASTVFFVSFLIKLGKFLYEQGDAGALLVSKTFDGYAFIRASAEQAVGGYPKIISQSNYHLNRRQHIVVFPIGYALLGYSHFLAKFHLI